MSERPNRRLRLPVRREHRRLRRHRPRRRRGEGPARRPASPGDAMFTCSDTNQQEMIDDVIREDLDGFVVACCSPKLHTFTFRGVAERAGVNPYQVTHVNLREQCSWTHTDDPAGATRKAIRLVTAGIARATVTSRSSRSRFRRRRASRSSAEASRGCGRRSPSPTSASACTSSSGRRSSGGHVADLGEMFPRRVTGRALVERMRERIARAPESPCSPTRRWSPRSGTYGNYRLAITSGDHRKEITVGQIVVATGFDDATSLPRANSATACRAS